MQIGRYEVRRILGQGSMGKVYLAVDPKLGRQVAVKVLNANTDDPQLRKRFLLEAKAIAALKHPNIVELYDYSGEDAEELFLVMEYVPGPSLYVLQSERGLMTEQTALCVGHELALALQHAHDHQVVHRDLKPENVLLHRGRVVLTDFGVVKAIATGNPLGVQTVHTRTQVLGTPGFMAPEQFGGKKIDHRCDLFSLGSVLYNLVTGHLPHEGANIDEIYRNLKGGRYLDARQHNSLLTDDFCTLIDRCLATRPKDRPGSADVLRGQMMDLLRVSGVTEVRDELLNYETNPKDYAESQRERSLEVLVRDLKVALKDDKRSEARAVLDRMRTIAPVDDRMEDISGVTLDARRRPVLSGSRGKRGKGRAFWFGMLSGALVGGLATIAAVVLDLIPDMLWIWLRSMIDQLG